MNRRIAHYLNTHKEELLESWMNNMREVETNLDGSISHQVFKNTSKEFIDLIVSNTVDSDDRYNEKAEELAKNVVLIGWPLTFLTKGGQTLKELIYQKMVDEEGISGSQKAELLEGLDQWLTPIINQLIEEYSNTWERTVSMQKIALQELSAPLIPVFEKISIMPLIGTIDTDRARLIMENLLDGVLKHRADVVLIDITGVPVVDTMVAQHIIQAADAVRLVGAKCMLVGIRPEIAQTIINLGIDLNHITTTSTLRKGIEEALGEINRKIVIMEG